MKQSLRWDREMDVIKLYVILITALQCDGISISKQLAHIARRRAESKRGVEIKPTRRFGADASSVILGRPSLPRHLPPAEPILPGHTLLRPSMGMLKSAAKFPHKELEDGAGVYGHIDNLGIRYDGKNERVMYTNFRRSLPTYRKRKIRKNGNFFDQDMFRSLKPHRRDEEVRPVVMVFNEAEAREAVARQFREGHAVSDELSSNNKTKWFWETKDSFNHVKINHDAPNHSDLLPEEALNDVQNWWFYHQKDLEEFGDRWSTQIDL